MHNLERASITAGQRPKFSSRSCRSWKTARTDCWVSTHLSPAVRIGERPTALWCCSSWF